MGYFIGLLYVTDFTDIHNVYRHTVSYALCAMNFIHCVDIFNTIIAYKNYESTDQLLLIIILLVILY